MNNKFNLIQTNTVLEHDSIKPYFKILSRPIVADIIRDTLEKLRIEIKNKNASYSKEDIIKLCEKKVKQRSNLPIKKVINATGTIMHTNLGRSPIDSDVWDEVKALNTASNNLEYNINSEGRGLRGEFLYSLLAKLTGAEDALVVNNNAAAVFLILKTLASDKEVIDLFAKKIKEKLENIKDVQKLPKLKVKGKYPYRRYPGMPLKPAVIKHKCDLCGACVINCPVNAIPKENPMITDKKKCISCMGCHGKF